MNSQNIARSEYRVWSLWTRFDALWCPPPEISVAEWADRERRLSQESSVEPGRWVTDRAPYQRGIMDAISDPRQQDIVIMSAAQIGKSEILNNVIGMYIDIDPCPMMLVQPTIEDAEDYSKDRIAPMIRDTPSLSGKVKDPRSRDSGNTLRHKKFPGGQLFLGGANSPSGLASKPIRLLLLDEIDRYPASAGSEGDPVLLARKRTQNFWNRKVIQVSTPTIKGLSRIEKLYESSTMEQWHVPCPKCGVPHPIEWGNFNYKNLDDIRLKCPACGQYSGEQEWKSQQSRGKWVPRKEHHVRGFHINAFSSPWTSWRELIFAYMEAKKDGDDAMKVWWNTVLGIPWEETGNAIEVENLEEHREEYGAEIPDGVLILTCGIDTQDDRLEAEVVGWGPRKESWGICYRVFYGDPGQPLVWEALDEFLLSLWNYADGEQIGIACACIDSGGHYTDEVYKFCKSRERRNVFAVKGSSVYGKPGVSKPSRNNRRRVALFSLGVDALKGSLFSRLKVESPGPGYCHWPRELKTNHRGYDLPYFKGLVSEKLVVRRVGGKMKVEWVKRYAGVRNEPLDVRVYATAALEILNPDLERRRERRTVKRKGSKPAAKKRKEPPLNLRQEPPPQPPPEPQPKNPPSKQATQKRRGGVRVLNGGMR